VRTPLALAGAAIALWASGNCGGAGSPSAPSGPSGGAVPTITITAAGVNPPSLTVAAGSRVTFMNQDGRTHFMASDPHPDHSDCPEINQVGSLPPGQSRETGNLVVVRTCGFHDHDQPTNNSLKGRIVVQ
jgi:plastocyanin